MKAKILILSILFLLAGCRTKTVQKDKEKERLTEIVNSEVKSEVQNEKQEEKKETKKSEISEQKKQTSTDTEIEGKTEIDKPFTYTETKDGDTIKTIEIIGNATFKIKSKTGNESKQYSENTKTNLENRFQDFSRSLVKEENLKKVAKDIKKTAKKIKVTDTSTGIYITFISLGVVAIIVFFIFLYFKKNKK